MKIGIDGRLLHRNVTGLERYVHNIFNGVCAKAPENEYRIYTRFSIYHEEELPRNAIERSFASKSDMLVTDFLCQDGPALDLYHMTWFGDDFIDLLPLCISPSSVLTVHDLMSFRNPSYLASQDMYAGYTQRCRRAVSLADKIIAVSNHTKSDILGNFDVEPEKIEVVLEGVDNRFCQLKDREFIETVKARYGLRKPFMLYVTTDYPHKNHNNLIHAFHHVVREKKMSSQLVFVGEKRYMKNESELKRLIAGLGLEEDVIWLEHIDDNELNALYNGADLFVYPSLDEGFGLPILEAMACGIPVAASNAASIPEVTGDAALLFDPTDISDIVDSIETLWNNHEVRRRLIERGYKRCAELTWKKCAEGTLAVYREANKIGETKQRNVDRRSEPYPTTVVRDILEEYMKLEKKVEDLNEALELREEHLQSLVGARGLRYIRKLREILRKAVGF